MILSTEMLRKVVENCSGWEAALIDAETQIAGAEKRIAQLRATASVIRKMIASGEPWPGDSNSLVAMQKSVRIHVEATCGEG